MLFVFYFIFSVRTRLCMILHPLPFCHTHSRSLTLPCSRARRSAHDPVEIARYLLDKGASAAATAKGGETLLHLLTATPRPAALVDAKFNALVEMLVEAGADLTAKTSFGRTVFHTAARGGYASTINALARYSLDTVRFGRLIDERDEGGSTALHEVRVAVAGR